MRVPSLLFRVGIFSIVLSLTNTQVLWAKPADANDKSMPIPAEAASLNAAVVSTGTDLRFAAARLVAQNQASSANSPAMPTAHAAAPTEVPRRSKSRKWLIIIGAAVGAAVVIAVATHTDKDTSTTIAAGPPTVGPPQ
jgi:hypothetical protein